MNHLQITGLPRGKLLEEIVSQYPEWKRIDNEARRLVGPRSKREVWIEQGAAIAYLASQYDFDGASILEIGACQGYSAALMSLAAPKATLTTLEPHGGRRTRVRAAVGSLGIVVRAEDSTTFLGYCVEERKQYDLIFVDGDHANVALDLPYWNLLKQDGLLLHHDYSPEGSKRECRSVFEALNHFAEQLNHPIDVLVQDDGMVGLAGWYRHDVEQVWPPKGMTLGASGYLENIGVLNELVTPEEEDEGQDDVIDNFREEAGTSPTDEDQEENDAENS